MAKHGHCVNCGQAYGSCIMKQVLGKGHCCAHCSHPEQ